MKKTIFLNMMLLALILIFGQAGSAAFAAEPIVTGINPVQMADEIASGVVSNSVRIADEIVTAAVSDSITTTVNSALSVRSDIRVLGGERTIEAGAVIEKNIIVMGGELEVERDAVIYGDISVYGGDATFERGTEIHGTVRVYGGDLSIAGTVYGDVIMLGGETDLESSAVIEGDVKTVGGKVNRSRSAVINGNIMSGQVGGASIDVSSQGRTERVRSVFSPLEFVQRTYRVLFGSFVSIVFYLIFAMLGAFLLMKIGPKHVTNAEAYLLKAPWMTFLIGFVVSIVIVPLVALLLSVTILLIPVAFLLVLALIIAMFYGYVILGSLIGKELKRRIGLDWDPVRLTVLGTAVLIIASQVINMLPAWIDWIPEFVAASLGVGAVSQYLYAQIISKGNANSAVLSGGRPGSVTIPREGTLDQPETFKKASDGEAETDGPATGEGSPEPSDENPG